MPKCCVSDYFVTIHTKIQSSKEPEQRPYSQEILFSTYGPPRQEHVIQGDYTRTLDDVYLQATTKGDVIAFKVSEKNERAYSRPLWANHGFGDNV